MSVLSGTQLNLLSCLNADNGIAQVEEQEPIADYIWFISKDSDITPELYQYVNDLFIYNLLILDLETYGYKIPENGEYKKKLTSIKQKQKKGTTTGLQEMAISPSYGDIRLLQLAALCSEKVLVVDFKTIWDRPQLSDDYNKFINYLIEKLKEFAKSKGVLVGHNIGFDLGFLRAKYSIKFWKAYDTMIMSQLLSAGILTYKHGLKDCCSRYLGIEVDKTEQSADNSLPLRNAQINYAASDIANTGELFLVLRNEIKIARLEAVTEIEAKFTPALVEINYWGMPVDIQELNRQIKWYYKKLNELDKEFQRMYPFMNIKSSKQIGTILAILDKKDADLDESDDKEIDDEKEVFDAIKVVKSQGSSKADLALLEDLRVVQIVVDYRKVTKFLEYCLQVKQEIVIIEGIPRVSGSIGQLTKKGQGRTRSGNKNAPVKCQGINLQNAASKKSLNKRLIDAKCPMVREIFNVRQLKVPSNFELTFINISILYTANWLMDFRIVDVDLPAAHLAIATYMSGETDVAEGIDRHAITMKCVFDSVDSYKEYSHLSVKEITDINNNGSHPLFKKFKKIRSMCKEVVYSGLNFGSAPTLQTTIKTNINEELPLPVCEAMTNAFPVILPKIAQLRETLWKKANENKICVDGYWYGTFQDDYGLYATPGYRRRIYSRCKVNKYNQHYVPKGDIANCWLATESSSVKWGIATIYQENVFTDKFDLRLSSICHDEVVLFCRKFQDIEVAKLTQDSMRQGLEKFTGNKIPYPDLMVNPRKLISVGWEH
ncbi:MAG: hypothetical protein ACKPCP_00560 [Sphaerospermopsis kisseleviana]